MRRIYYDEVKEKIVVFPRIPRMDLTSYPLIHLGFRSELEIKIIQNEIERGTFEIEDWRK